ncbi:chemotaxis protein MotB [Clostridium botulinum]|uniref:OmpA/MotB family protein n=1 Tax=Clostridium botulinum TaxID=1491 RepID=UPI001A93A2E9|nr:flagellar motor protein MotB [Clostridium botulinum]MBO0523649.1 chemotaxis protein MotB [Clostridium botulinum]MBO0527668.1 chemotaxis protein MotB [Clostridium botulinum]MBO0531959.1 chemotaxis protein MotB [Clostridium botulinum]MBO0536492.1 chemotaxis protein MotB [Clostridium botulinum]MBO0539478.1 chemotaxis protein MotB [Clostridium botulinum]
MKKKEHREEHVDETWLIPYSDMLTLLLALFIVMFAMSKVDTEKLAKASQEFNIIFKAGSNVVQTGGGGGASVGKAGVSIVPSDSVTEDIKIKEIKSKLEKEIKKSGYSDKVKVGVDADGLEIDIQDVVLFNSGDAEVLKQSSALLTQISKMLKGLDNSIKVTGHTDNQPISNSKFRSNWDLSAIRAINVMNFLSDVGRIPANKLSIQAYGEYMPKFDNSTKDGRAKNRRVEIAIVRKYPLPPVTKEIDKDKGKK